MYPGMKEQLDRYYRCWFATNAIYDEWAKSRGLTANSLFALYLLVTQEGVTQRSVCQQLMLPKQTVGAVLDGFQAKGYLLRGESPDDRRQKRLELTPAGRDYAQAVVDSLTAMEGAVLARMESAEREAYFRSSETYLAELRREVDKG